MDIRGPKLSLFVYRLTNPEAVKPEDRVKIHQLDYTKPEQQNQ